MEGDLDQSDDSPAKRQVNYQELLDMFDSLTRGLEREGRAVPISLIDQQDEDWYVTHLASAISVDGYRPASRKDFR